MKKTNIIITLIAIVFVVAIGAYFFPEGKNVTNNVSSAVGTTFNSSKVAQINISPTINATTTSVYNSDDSDRWITSNYAACTSVGTSYTAYTGTGLSSVTITSATTTTSAPAAISNSNTVSLTMATATTEFLINTASTGSTSSYLTRWASHTYYTWAFNATNTAACTVGVHYVGS